MGNAVSEKLDKIEAAVNQAHQSVRQLISTLFAVQRLTTTLKDVLRPEFLESSPTQRTFGEKVKGICDDILVKGSKQVLICITGYFDDELVGRLQKILSVGGAVRIIVPELEIRAARTLKRLVEEYEAEVRIHPLLHARIFYVHRDGRPWGVIIGSGDITSDCLGGRRFDATIWSNHPDITKSTIDFFNRVWEDERAKKLSEIEQH